MEHSENVVRQTEVGVMAALPAAIRDQQKDTDIHGCLAAIDKRLQAIPSATGYPFPHLLVTELLDDDSADSALAWLQGNAAWSLEAQGFYIQHSSVLASSERPNEGLAILSAAFLQRLREHMERLFQVKLRRDRIEVYAHRMVPGHRIGIHTDCPVKGSESHRFLINLNTGFEDNNGGHLVLFDRENVADSAVIVQPVHNVAAAMEFSWKSFHYVDEIRAGVRYTVLYSFWREDGDSLEVESAPSSTPRPVAATEKQPADAISPEIMAALDRMENADLPHSSRTLRSHLRATHAILHHWGCDRDVCLAGLFHTILGTRENSDLAINEVALGDIRRLLGERAFMLVREYAALTRERLDEIIAGSSVEAPCEHTVTVKDGGFSYGLHERDRRALLELFWANALEQLRRLPMKAQVVAEHVQLFARTLHLVSPRCRRELTTVFGSDLDICLRS